MGGPPRPSDCAYTCPHCACLPTSLPPGTTCRCGSRAGCDASSGAACLTPTTSTSGPSAATTWTTSSGGGWEPWGMPASPASYFPCIHHSSTVQQRPPHADAPAPALALLIPVLTLACVLHPLCGAAACGSTMTRAASRMCPGSAPPTTSGWGACPASRRCWWRTRRVQAASAGARAHWAGSAGGRMGWMGPGRCRVAAVASSCQHVRGMRPAHCHCSSSC